MLRKTKRELRYQSLELASPDEKSRTITGYAAVFGQVEELAPGFFEVIEAGAFSECLASSPDVVALFNHDEDHLLGRTTSGTLRLSEDATGLRVEIDLPPTALGDEILALVERGDLSGMSFGFIATEETFEDRPDGTVLRRVSKAELFDVSVVTTPAYRGTSVSVRSASDIVADYRAAESARLRRRLKIKTDILKLKGQSFR